MGGKNLGQAWEMLDVVYGEFPGFRCVLGSRHFLYQPTLGGHVAVMATLENPSRTTLGWSLRNGTLECLVGRDLVRSIAHRPNFQGAGLRFSVLMLHVLQYGVATHARSSRARDQCRHPTPLVALPMTICCPCVAFARHDGLPVASKWRSCSDHSIPPARPL